MSTSAAAASSNDVFVNSITLKLVFSGKIKIILIERLIEIKYVEEMQH